VPAFATQLVQYEGLLGSVLADTANEWRRFVWRFDPTPIGDNADAAYTTFDFVNITGGLVDNTWTAGDYTTVEGHMTPLITSYIQSYLSVGAQYSGMKAYRMAFTELPSSPPIPPDRDKPFAPTGPPEHVTVAALPGSIPGETAPQVSISSTDKTAYPRHWGRNYWPFPGVGAGFTTGWQLSQSQVDGLANAMHTFYGAMQGSEFFPVVPITQMNKQPARALVTVNQVQVDSNVDVIRRRRARITRYRKVL